MNERICSSDLYECAFYLLNGAKLWAIEGIPVKNGLNCLLTVKGENLTGLQDSYLAGTAQVNLRQFRRTYVSLYGSVVEVKNQLKREFAQEKKALSGYEEGQELVPGQGGEG